MTDWHATVKDYFFPTSTEGKREDSRASKKQKEWGLVSSPTHAEKKGGNSFNFFWSSGLGKKRKEGARETAPQKGSKRTWVIFLPNIRGKKKKGKGQMP